MPESLFGDWRHFNIGGCFDRGNAFELMDVPAEDSLSQSIDKAVEHYSSLFWLPSLKRAVFLLALLCIVGIAASTIVLFPSLSVATNALLLGFALFSTDLFVDYAVSTFVLKRDPIYNFRRTVGFSIFCWGFWLFFILVGVASAVLFNSLVWWVRLSLLGFSAVVILRSIVFGATSSSGYERQTLAAFLQPSPCVIILMVFWAEYVPVLQMWPFFVFAPIICLVTGFLFNYSINNVGKHLLGVPSMHFLRAFLLNWVANLNAPFEELLEKMSTEQNIDVSLIKFDSVKPKAAVVVPSVHPGPFKNIGSSLLPSMLKNALEGKSGRVACVPLGLLGHELDLASQQQNQKIINQVVESASFVVSEDKATPFVVASDGVATACCQVFGNTAFLSFTLAPKTTEDLPQELSVFVQREAEKNGLDCCVVVNAHNSINETANMKDVLSSLEKVAKDCLEKIVSLKRMPFEIGAATVFPREFGLHDGMGPGGISAIAVRVRDQKTVYVVIDGNNMISGLREKVLAFLQSMGFDQCEVFTTDTHAVSALILGGRGYHPVGEVMDHEKLLGYIGEAVRAADADLERCMCGCRRMTVPNVKVIGKALVESLSLLMDKAINRSKRVTVPIFALSGFLLIAILMVL
ncbi:MAG TPA: DUF2070 family protein [Candidatus Bathyarchaeia archaeon]